MLINPAIQLSYCLGFHPFKSFWRFCTYAQELIAHLIHPNVQGTMRSFFGADLDPTDPLEQEDSQEELKDDSNLSK